ncbi:unnamed protein product [Caenorhabditis angaria]|uniref:Uncharacterized protein n=1 Tax=Caenorhabditis angaria TaxID=860376 RepID=A0A9P1J227_9PELO|nr:unnamed protein product [Caenorhabditis angaria]
MFLRKFWNQWTLEENARRMTITVLPSGTKKVHLKEPNELAELYPDRANDKAVALFSAAGLIKTTAGIKEDEAKNDEQKKESGRLS